MGKTISIEKKGKEKKTFHRIVFICPFLFRFKRGIERSCINLANTLSEKGQQVSIIAWEEKKSEVAERICSDVRVIKIPYVRYYRNIWAMFFYSWILLREKCDVINIYFADFGERGALAFIKKIKNIQINFIVGYPLEQVPHRFEAFKKNRFSQNLNTVIVKSQAMAKSISEFFGLPTRVIGNGVSANNFKPDIVDCSDLRKTLKLKNEDKVLLSVAALEERKGLQHGIKAIAALNKKGMNVKYIILGDGPYQNELQKIAKDLGVSSNVHFVGSKIDTLPYYELADVFLLLSQGEGFPNVLLEAWSMRLPVVVSSDAPFPDLVFEDFGYVVDKTDSQKVQEVLIKLFGSPELRKKIGENARKLVVNQYSWNQVAEEYLEIF